MPEATPSTAEDPVTIDWQSFPHIFDRILAYSDDDALSLLRATSHAVRRKCYDLLVEQVTVVERQSSSSRSGRVFTAALLSRDELREDSRGAALFRNCEAIWGCECDSPDPAVHAANDAQFAAEWAALHPTRSVDVCGRVRASNVSGLVRVMHSAPDWMLTLRPDAGGFHPLDVSFALPRVTVPTLALHLDLLDACAVGRYAVPMIEAHQVVVHLWFDPRDVSIDPFRGRSDIGPIARLATHVSSDITLIFQPTKTKRAPRESRGRLPWLWDDIVHLPLHRNRCTTFTLVNADSLPHAWIDASPRLDENPQREVMRVVARRAVGRLPYKEFNERFRFLTMSEYEDRREG